MNFENVSCPCPIQRYPHILLAHGGGGRLMQDLIEKMFIPVFANNAPSVLHDATVLNMPHQRIAFTSDSFVVKPLFFPGGDIGSLCVNGTVNDLAMSGAKPLYLSLSFILEEGLPMDTLWKIVQSIKKAADLAHVAIVTGDTKVVDRGKGDGLYINTSGIGSITHSLTISPRAVQSGDAVVISGDIGRHGMAIMAQREGLSFESSIESDCAPLHAIVEDLIEQGVEIHCLRDLTRGGLTSALNEISQGSGLGIDINEALVPVREDVASACEMLGFNPLYVANEGCMVMFMPEKHVPLALKILRQHPQGQACARIGHVSDASSRRVVVVSKIGVRRMLDMMSGEQLPRIC